MNKQEEIDEFLSPTISKEVEELIDWQEINENKHGSYEYHEYANLFPMVSQEELKILSEDIKKNGLYNKIILLNGKILDGRNRFEACRMAGVVPDFTTIDQNTDPLSYVISTNLKRRHLNSSQRAMIAADLANMEHGGNRKNQEPKLALDNKPNLANSVSIEQAAKLLNVSTGSVKTAKDVKVNHPERIKDISSGLKTVSSVVKEEKKIEQIKNLKEKEILEITDKYDVIVIDPAWQMEKIERNVAPNQIGFDYPTMTDDEIKDFKLPSADNCHVFLWTTHKHLPLAFDVLKSWNVKYVNTFVWHKNGGFQPFDLPQYNCEFCLYGRIGTPVFTETKNFFTCFSADRNGHSVKPEEFYETIRRVTSGKRIDIFNRRKINGFDTYGNEAE